MSVNDSDAHSRIAEYRSKRRRGTTPEPFDAGQPRPGHFVVHQHDATRMHYDLRLEVNGVLRSWAVPNGPSLDPSDKRLAVETEDHPVQYLDFEDVIPEGNYGAGAMIVWDRGHWVQRHDDQTGDNKLLFDLYGHKLRGRWTLVRTSRSPKEWLLIKKKDGFACSGDAARLPMESVYSGLTVRQLAGGHTPADAVRGSLQEAGAVRGRVNASEVEPMLARGARDPFSRSGWLFELKYDGYRLLAGTDERQAYLRYRNGGDATDLYPEIVPALAALPYSSLVLDGEVVVIGDDGRPSFARLARRARLGRGTDIRIAALENAATYFVFDLLEFEGLDLRSLPLQVRKAALERLIPRRGPVRLSEHIERQGRKLFEQVRRMGLEGVVAKRASSKYRAGRSDQWVKIRADRSADFVVVGFTLGKGSRKSLGALLLGVHDAAGGLVYLGRVGSGFRDRDLAELRATLEQQRLDAREPAQPAVQLPPVRSRRQAQIPKPDEAVWTRPETVVEVRFKEITDEGLLRHPVFLRLRPDKDAGQCDVRQSALQRGGPVGAIAAGDGVVATEGAPAVASAPRTVITRPDKVLWPEDGYTKADLIEYYTAVADWILPYLDDRPLVLDRYPDGIHGNSFFQKHAPHFTPDWVRTASVHSESGERDTDYFVVDDVETLVYIANSAAIPLHVWSSRLRSLQRPDWTVLDLDPKRASFRDVVRVARAIKQLCDQIGLPCYAKTSGKTGMHVLVPLGGQVEYEHGRMLADLLALVVARRVPEIATVSRSLQGRGDRVYIDAVQNGAGRLLVAPLCVRPFPGATVSTPLRWREVNARLDMHRFTIKTVPTRLRRMRDDPMLPVLTDRPDLMAALSALSRIERGDC